MNFIESISVCFQKYFDFKGRASRSECWFFILFTFIYTFVAGILLGAIGATTETIDAATIFIVLPIIAPYFAVVARRLHDFNHSGWMQLIFVPGWFADLILGTGWVIYVVNFAVFAFYISQKPMTGKNKFGPKPKK